MLAFLVLPATFAGAIPVGLGVLDPRSGTGYKPAAALIVLGAIVLGWCVRDFYVSGKGTLAPWAPPTQLVVVGLYRFTRNPMYIGVIIVVAGLAWWFRSPVVAAYAAVLALVFHLRVTLYEEPHLQAKFDPDWADYERSVPRWRPRLSAYQKTLPPTHS